MHGGLIKCELVVEVFTLNPPREAEEVDSHWKYLLRRVEEIRSPFVLGIDFSNLENPPDQKQAKQILTALKEWFLTNPDIQQEKSIDNIKFMIVSRNSANQQAGYMLSPTIFAVSTENLRDDILKKTKKYHMLNSINIKFVVAIVPNVITGVDLNNLKDVLWGTETFDVDFERNTAKPRRTADGLYTRVERVDPALSAVMWVPKKLGIPLSMPQVGIFPNPSARNSLSPECMKTLKGSG